MKQKNNHKWHNDLKVAISLGSGILHCQDHQENGVYSEEKNEYAMPG